jgi:hypothetical protein
MGDFRYQFLSLPQPSPFEDFSKQKFFFTRLVIILIWKSLLNTELWIELKPYSFLDPAGNRKIFRLKTEK